jgi:hypothetical protein
MAMPYNELFSPNNPYAERISAAMDAFNGGADPSKGAFF